MEDTLQQRITRLGIVVVIPTYNNEKTLRRVLDGVLEYTAQIIVVNDGSTDTTSQILNDYNGLERIDFAANKGKGCALRVGLSRARELGYHYAISIDSDGQHYPSDLSTFVEVLEEAKAPLLLIGARNMTQDSVPKKSSFGNKFSNFWFWFETGIKLEDTQSGYRAYPLLAIPQKYYTRKFEFEIEIIVRAAWNGVAVRNIPVQVLYDPEERVSHFRPFKDFTRISILNTVLVFLTFFYIIPRNFFRSFKKKSLNEFIKENIFGSEDSPEKMAASIGFGVFMGIAPVWGFQTALVITLSVFLRLNKVLSFAFSNISLPPFIPLIIYASLIVGEAVLPSSTTKGVLQLDNISFDTIQQHLLQYLVGSLLLATIMGLLVGFGSYVLIRMKQPKSVSAE
ncbi:DUF2062 domain-containing protein [Sphingobacterium yanglingense]|uniref:Glycosyltransferase involved in cell wall biosynthesis n=1 Tax=Sphingobacterium yanglingense TaxID=1437280 RepID=A0A4R6WDF4_9SPHI|nr:DUF2062 domain-containing protein [Sphingobacterium yanglingense]TDQ75843.1 glycosyltransferase involved in cell wall biosynthesis [Sphingobacterium yanglingense]